MPGSTDSTAIARARRALARAARRTWQCDRTTLRGFARGWNRVARIGLWTGAGLVRHGLSVRAAALTYYTVFSIVPILTAAIWLVRSLHISPASAAQIASAALPESFLTALHRNAPLLKAAGTIIDAAEKRAPRYGELVGVLAVAYGILRLITNVDRALDAVAGLGRRRLEPLRLLGHAILVIVAPALVAVGFLLVAAGPSLIRSERIAKIMAHLPSIDLVSLVVLPVAALWGVLVILFRTVARDRIPLRSAAVGGATGTLALGVVLTLFAMLQVGTKRAGLVGASMAAVPVLMLWAYSSWLTVLLAAEVAVGHATDHAWPGGLQVWPVHESAEGGIHGNQ